MVGSRLFWRCHIWDDGSSVSCTIIAGSVDRRLRKALSLFPGHSLFFFSLSPLLLKHCVVFHCTQQKLCSGSPSHRSGMHGNREKRCRSVWDQNITLPSIHKPLLLSNRLGQTGLLLGPCGLCLLCLCQVLLLQYCARSLCLCSLLQRCTCSCACLCACVLAYARLLVRAIAAVCTQQCMRVLCTVIIDCCSSSLHLL